MTASYDGDPARRGVDEDRGGVRPAYGDPPDLDTRGDRNGAELHPKCGRVVDPRRRPHLLSWISFRRVTRSWASGHARCGTRVASKCRRDESLCFSILSLKIDRKSRLTCQILSAKFDVHIVLCEYKEHDHLCTSSSYWELMLRLNVI
jgi:hypothetical protein